MLFRSPGTNQPVTGAEVNLEYYGPEHPRIMPSPYKSVMTTRTDDAGAFDFHLDDIGYYYIRTKKNGYISPGLVAAGPRDNQEVTLTAEQPSMDVRLVLVRPGRVSGRVVDRETGKPIPNLRVSAARVSNFGGRKMFLGSAAATDTNGDFTVANAAPGDYVIEVRPQKPQKERLLTKFTEDDVAAVDGDFEHTFWPGGHGEEAALPVLLPSGGQINVGVLPVKKVEYYRVLAHLPIANCGPGDRVDVLEYRQDAQFAQYTNTIAQTPCGQDVLITGWAPGAYRLMLSVGGRKTGERLLASIPFVITNKNVEITASLERPIAVDGVFTLAEGANSVDLSKAAIWLDPVGGVRFADMAEPMKAGEGGKFSGIVFPVADHRVEISGVPPGGYVKEIRYNGVPIDGKVLPLNMSAMAQTIMVVVDDKPAAISGTVMKGDQAVSKPFLILARWPLARNQVFIPTAQTTAGGDGKFQFGGLAPGEYRIVAVADRGEYENRSPGTVERALASATKIEVSAGGFQNVKVEFLELR